MKQLICLLLILTIVIPFLPLPSFADETEEAIAPQDTTVETADTAVSDFTTDEADASAETTPIEETVPEESMETDTSQVQVLLPSRAAFYIGKNHSFAVADLLKSGFIKIQALENTDIHTDFINGAVLSVSVAGNADFQEGQQFASDAPIVVEYYRQTGPNCH